MIRRYIVILIVIVLILVIAAYSFAKNTQNTPLVLGGQNADQSNLEQNGNVLPRDLLMTSETDGNLDIFLFGTDGSFTNLTDDGSSAVDMIGTWSMDGQTIQFLSNRRDINHLGPTTLKIGGGELKTMSVLEAVFLLFRDKAFDWDPSWSPDGSNLLWASLRDLNLELYSIASDVEVNLSNARRLTSGSERDWFHAWSPDGSKIAYSSDITGNEDIYVMDFRTGISEQLTNDPNDDSRPVWTRDGNQILFVSERDVPFISGGLRLYIMDVDGSNQQILPDDMIVEAGAVWSPGASHIAYFSNKSGNWHIYVEQSDGSNARQLTQGSGNYLLPVWRP